MGDRGLTETQVITKPMTNSKVVSDIYSLLITSVVCHEYDETVFLSKLNDYFIGKSVSQII